MTEELRIAGMIAETERCRDVITMRLSPGQSVALVANLLLAHENADASENLRLEARALGDRLAASIGPNTRAYFAEALRGRT